MNYRVYKQQITDQLVYTSVIKQKNASKEILIKKNMEKPSQKKIDIFFKLTTKLKKLIK